MEKNTEILEILKQVYAEQGKTRTAEQITEYALSQLLFKEDRQAWYTHQAKKGE